MVGRKTGNAKAGEAISKAGFQNVAAQEGQWGSGGNLQRLCAATRLKQLEGSEWGIAFSNHPMMMCSIAYAVVQDVAP